MPGDGAAVHIAARRQQQRVHAFRLDGGEAAAEKSQFRFAARTALHQRVKVFELLPQRDFPAGNGGDFFLRAEHTVVRASGMRDKKRDGFVRGATPHP